MFTRHEDTLSFTTTNFVPRSKALVVSVDIGILIMQGVARLEIPPRQQQQRRRKGILQPRYLLSLKLTPDIFTDEDQPALDYTYQFLAKRLVLVFSIPVGGNGFRGGIVW